MHRRLIVNVDKINAIIESVHENGLSQVSHARGNMYKLQKHKYDIRKYFLLKGLLTCGTHYHPRLSMHRHLIVLRHD